jgi:4-amino-4-deoxy-L-arabinose transferase-like glycosyltransferase
MDVRRRFRFILLGLLLAVGGLYLIGNQRVPLWDRDEPRYAECSRQMLLSGDWVVPWYLDYWRTEKPPVIYWAQAGVMAVMGDTAQASRLPSAVATIGSALVLAAVVRKFAGAKRAAWSALIFCTAGLVIAAAKMCITDATLTFFVISGQACLAIMYASGLKHLRERETAAAADAIAPNDSAPVVTPRRKYQLAPLWVSTAFWISLAMAGLTKGPQALGFHAVTLLVLLGLDIGFNFKSKIVRQDAIGWWREFRPVIGIPILAVLTAPWVILMHIRAPGFVHELFHKVQMHTQTSMEGHGQPFGYHLVLIFGTFFPWSLLLPMVIWKAYLHRRTPQVRFAIAAACGPWLLMECVTTKLPFYVLPAFPGLAFLTADAVVRCIRGQHRDLVQKGFFAAVIVWSIAALGISLGVWALPFLLNTRDLPFIGMSAFSLCGLLYVASVNYFFAKKQPREALIILGLGMILMVGILFGGVLPGLTPMQTSVRLANDLRSLGATGYNMRIGMIDYKEPSLAFYQGGGAREEDDLYLQSTNPADWPKWIVISQTAWNKVPPAIQQLLTIVQSESGFDYAAGIDKITKVDHQHVKILILQKK